MSNRHIKVINGRKYYYESIRVGKKVTSRYLGPVERIRRKKRSFLAEENAVEEQIPAQVAAEEPAEEQDDSGNNYIG